MVARYNPCGRPVEIGRRAYRTHARLYVGGPLFEILWYPARDDVPFLRGPNAINSNEWQGDRPDEFDQLAVGEDVEAKRVFANSRPNPLAIGGHVCGTRADYAGDGVYDPAPPYVDYRPDGLPWCCGAYFASEGGLAIGGTAYVATPKVGTGGLVLGGTAGTLEYVVGTGGLAIGGTADVWQPERIYGTGGLVLGGTADVWQPERIYGTGGLVLGGTAVVFVPGFWFRDEPGFHEFTAVMDGPHLITVHGGGGAGADWYDGGGMPIGGGGGGGGAWSQLTANLVAGVTYTVYVGGGGGLAGTAGEGTVIYDPIPPVEIVSGAGGEGGSLNIGGDGGTASSGGGVLSWRGGHGGDGSPVSSGGGGGGGAGSTGNGGDGLEALGGSGTAAGGGDGGDGGVTSGASGDLGQSYGGGGGGGQSDGGGGASGAGGFIAIAWPV